MANFHTLCSCECSPSIPGHNENFFGGALGLTSGQMVQVNGFSNFFLGWGGEDNDMERRVKFHGYFYPIPQGPIGYYTANTVNHTKAKDNTITR